MSARRVYPIPQVDTSQPLLDSDEFFAHACNENAMHGISGKMDVLRQHMAFYRKIHDICLTRTSQITVLGVARENMPRASGGEADTRGQRSVRAFYQAMSVCINSLLRHNYPALGNNQRSAELVELFLSFELDSEDKRELVKRCCAEAVNAEDNCDPYALPHMMELISTLSRRQHVRDLLYALNNEAYSLSSL